FPSIVVLRFRWFPRPHLPLCGSFRHRHDSRATRSGLVAPTPLRVISVRPLVVLPGKLTASAFQTVGRSWRRARPVRCTAPLSTLAGPILRSTPPSTHPLGGRVRALPCEDRKST